MENWVRECGPEPSSQAIALAEHFLLSRANDRKQKDQQVWVTTEAVAGFPDAEKAPTDAPQGPPFRWIVQEGDGGTVSQGDNEEEPRRLLLERARGQEEGQQREKTRGDEKYTEGSPPSHETPNPEEKTDDSKERTQCLVCGKSFRWKSGFRSHLKTHTEERPFHCAVCGRNFGHPLKLIRHQGIHTGEKPFQCAECGKSFSRKKGLASHQKRHAVGKAYKCLQCGMSFQQTTTLTSHLQTHLKDASCQ